MLTRKIGDTEVSAVGMGCWAIGGPFTRDGRPVGWGEVEDEVSRKSIRKALDLGITFFDTADVYGCGHSERVLSEALGKQRRNVFIATKFGNRFDEATRTITGSDASPEYIRSACEQSLRRLKTDVIDLYQLHLGALGLEEAAVAREALEVLVKEGKIRFYGWSTDDPERAAAFAEGAHCASVQQRLNVFEGNTETLAVCERHDIASINRGPLGMGLLTGKFTKDTVFPDNDLRTRWDMQSGDQAKWLETLDRIRSILTGDGRTLAQGALGWLLGRSEKTVPIPGFKTPEQVAENAATLGRGPLGQDQMKRIAELLPTEGKE